MGAHDYVLVLVTAPPGEAERLARLAIERELAACVNLVPGLRSIYRWQGRICEDDEVLLLLKTRSVLVPALCEQLVAAHPYALPEVIALPIVAGHTPYLQWIAEATARAASPDATDADERR